MKKGLVRGLLQDGCESVFVATTAAFTTTATTVAATAFTTTTAAAAVTAATTTTVAAATTATAITTTAAAGRTGLHGTCFIHDQAATTQWLTIHARDGCLRLSVTAHFHKTKAFGAAGVALHHDLGAGNGAKLTKRLFQVAIAHGIRQVADVQFVAHSGTP